MNQNSRVTLALWVTVVLWGSAFVGIRTGLTGLSAGPLALLRYAVASLLMLIFYLRLPTRQSIDRKDWLGLALCGLFGIGLYNLAINYGEVTISAGITGFITGLMPVMILLLAVGFLKESVSKLGWLGVMVSLAGLGLIAWSEHQGSVSWLSVLSVFAAVVCGSIYAIIQKPFLKKFHPIELTAFSIWGGTLVLSFFTPQLCVQAFHAGALSLWSGLYLGVFPAAIAYALWSYALANTTVVRAAPYLYLMPVIATLLGMLILGEHPSWSSLMGGVIVLLGVIIVNFSRQMPRVFCKRRSPC